MSMFARALIARINEMKSASGYAASDGGRKSDTTCNEFFIKNGKPLIDMSDVLPSARLR